MVLLRGGVEEARRGSVFSSSEYAVGAMGAAGVAPSSCELHVAGKKLVAFATSEMWHHQCIRHEMQEIALKALAYRYGKLQFPAFASRSRVTLGRTTPPLTIALRRYVARIKLSRTTLLSQQCTFTRCACNIS